MRHLGLLKPDTFVTLLNWIGLPLVAVYLFSMFIYPFIGLNGNWWNALSVWDRWQGLNIGMLAFLSSIIALNISRYNANKQRERDFLAAKAFLPATLSELCKYFKLSASVFVRAWEINENNEFDVEAPKLPDDYREVFGRCIQYAESDVGDFLSRILVRLQVHDSRIKELANQYNSGQHVNPDRHALISYLYRIAQLQVFVNKLFPFARNEENFDSSPLDWEVYRNAFRNLDVWIDDLIIDENMNLKDFTKRAIARNNSYTA